MEKLKVRGKGERVGERGRKGTEEQYIPAFVCYDAPSLSFWSKPYSYNNTTHRETYPPPRRNDLNVPIGVNSGYRVALGCPCLESGKNGTELGRGFRRELGELCWTWKTCGTGWPF